MSAADSTDSSPSYRDTEKTILALTVKRMTGATSVGLTSGLTISPNSLLNSREYAMTAVSSIKICFLMKLLANDTVCNRLEMMFLFIHIPLEKAILLICLANEINYLFCWALDAIGSYPLLHSFRTVSLAWP